ncbi:MAG TPA: hypothetical protein VHU87_07740 [Rhizomicrobium sp.]|jgi:hypothetical protein|nr:hypothetical protein [Rhizomicrobium sp.]
MNGKLEDEKVKKLQALAATNKAATAFFEWAAERHKDMRETTIPRAADVCHVEYWQMREVFAALADIGAGTYITGRRGAKSRVKWLYSLNSIGKAAKGEYISLKNISEDENSDVEIETSGLENPSAIMEHSYKLRAEHTIKLGLPADLTTREAERLAAWIKTLPFE